MHVNALTVNHSILLSQLEKCVGIKGTLLWGAPRVYFGSLLYVLHWKSILEKHNISFNFFVDDVQIYLPFKPNDSDSWQPLFNCLSDLKIWLNLNFLCLNESKTKIIVLGHPDQLNGCAGTFGPLWSYVDDLPKIWA